MAKAPKYAKVGNTAMELQPDGKYYRHNGRWVIEWKEKDGKIYTDTQMKHLKDVEIIEITKEQWKLDNGMYVTISEKLKIADENIAKSLDYFERHSSCELFEVQTPFEKVFTIFDKKMFLVIHDGTFIVKHAIHDPDGIEFGISILRMPIEFFAPCVPVLHAKINDYVNGFVKNH